MQENIDVQLKCIDIERKSIDERNVSLNKLDQKIGIFTWFYFLFFIESLNFLQWLCFCIKVLFVVLSIIGIVFLIKSFFVKRIKNQYFNMSHMISYDRANYKKYIKDIHADYWDIKKELDNLIKDRNEDFKISMLFFGIWFLIILFTFIII